MKIIQMALIGFCVVLFANPCRAQQGEYGVAAISGPDGVRLLIGRDILSQSSASQTGGWIGYNIYKKESGKNTFKKINDRPVARVKTLAELESRLGEELNLLLGFVKIDNKTEFWRMIENREEKVLVLTMLDPPLREALGLSYLDKDVKKGNKYIYAVTRVNTEGKESPYSDSSAVIFGKAPFDLNGPLNFKGKASDNQVRLEWQVNPADTGAFFFSVYRASAKEGPFERLNDRPIMLFYSNESNELPTGAFLDTTVQNGRVYYYAVVSIDIAGNESPKRPLMLCPKDNQPPAIPQEVIAKSSAMGVTLSWKVIPEPDLAGFIIYRSQIPESLFTRLNNALSPPDSGYWEDKSAAPNTQYYYYIVAVDKSGNLSEPSATTFSLFENRKQPLPPEILIAEGTPEGVRIQWRPNTDPDLFGYYVFRGDGIDDVPVQVSPLIGKDTTFYHDTDSHLSPKGTYRYHIKAVNYTGVLSMLSAPMFAKPGIIVPVDPPLSFYGYQDVIGNRLFWTPTSDNTAAGYSIYRTLASDTSTWQLINSSPLPSSSNNFTDSIAGVGISYLYRIKSVDQRGNEGKPSLSISLSKFAPPPLPPPNVTISKAEVGLKIVWDISLEPRVAGYRIYRRSGMEPSVLLNQELLKVSIGEYRDKSVKPGARYFYTVTCVGADGREGAHSNEATYFAR